MIRAGHQLQCPTRSRHLYTPLRNRNNRIDACGLSTTPDDGTPSVPDALSSASTTAAGLAAAAGGGGWAGGSAGGEGCRRGLKMRTMMRPKMIRSSRKMHCRRPVFFWYLHADGEVTLAQLVNRNWPVGDYRFRGTLPKVRRVARVTEEKPPQSDTL